MNWLDYAILTIIVLSAVISLIRGFVREVLSLLVWIAAFWIGIRFSPQLTVYLDDYIASPTLQLGIAFTVLFVTTLLIGAIINYLAGQLVGRTGLTGTDRLIGIIFGVARGLVVVAVLMLAAGLTALPREPWWQESTLVPHIQPLVCRVGVQDWLDGMMVYAPLGDNDSAVAEGTHAPEYWREFCEDSASGDSSDAAR
ncbi:membrane protein required for colicin V production [Natronocella acetinitrilica]|uniref:Membrane protein required for colicin V production n=1 Tax=Natronocella acetinitrilica TaxID=414046 RepID=A0AAE3KAM2_9GAMM|nr:CvpA family protein [Natronocella acetinitrilica]MCP1673714.1 membrane protein required for colicin V production [Natronocella acetinitrilica]